MGLGWLGENYWLSPFYFSDVAALGTQGEQDRAPALMKMLFYHSSQTRSKQLHLIEVLISIIYLLCVPGSQCLIQ